jgi:hypothetical protein
MKLRVKGVQVELRKFGDDPLHHRRSCSGRSLLIQINQRLTGTGDIKRDYTLPYMLVCSEILGGCGSWSDITKSTKEILS